MSNSDNSEKPATKKRLGVAASIGAMIALIIDSALLNVPIGTVIGNWIAGLF